MSGGEPCPEDLGANITGDSDCSNAPLITTNGTYYGNTTAFTNLPAPPQTVIFWRILIHMV
ncbi:MAG: hypothetical protein M9916_12300 [Crocinitomicaceae bacterium]|nr:hypothetical protein [Crocinitomicaceae bacterium]